MATKTMLAAAAILTVFGAEAAAEPASADPAFRVHQNAALERRPLADLSALGAPVSLYARGRRASVDCTETLENLEDSRGLAGFLPGYPQPAYVTFDLKVAF